MSTRQYGLKPLKTYENKTQNCKGSHEDTWPSTQSHGVDLDEWLGCTQGKEGIEIRSAEQEQNGCSKTEDPSRKSTCNNPLAGNNPINHEHHGYLEGKVNNLAFLVSSAM
jgi:hypothetical protein